MVVRSGWEPQCKVERYENNGVPGQILDEIANVVHMHKYGERSAQNCDNMREIRNNVSDCTRGDMMYIVIRHDKKTQNNELQTVRGRLDNDGSAAAMHDGTRNAASTQAHNTPSSMRMRKRQSRRPTTSALSDKVWREMRKQITGRAQDDGVT